MKGNFNFLAVICTFSLVVGGVLSVSGDFYSECSKHNATCWVQPKNCVKTRSCSMMLRHSSVHGGVKFQLMSDNRILHYGSYAAVGVSDSGNMKDTSASLCLGTTLKVQNALTYEFGVKFLKDPSDGFIGTPTVKFNNGMLYCNFTRKNKQKFYSKKYDMSKNKYYLIMVKGPIKNGAPEHHINHYVSSSKMHLNGSGAAIVVNSGLLISTVMMVIHRSFFN